MKKRFLIFSLVASCFVALPNVLTAQEKAEAVLANAHGLQQWSDVEVIEFTFSVDREPPVNRAWKWEVKDHTVTRTVAGESFVIDLDAMETEEATEVHKQFINDSFWFLFPFNVVWSNPDVTDSGLVEIELGGEKVETTKVTALWPSDEGYTPGDAYDLFIGENQTILGWTFRRANAEEGTFFEWKNPMQAGPIRFTAEYFLAGSEKPMISMTDVRVRMAGNPEWMLPVPRP